MALLSLMTSFFCWFYAKEIPNADRLAVLVLYAWMSDCVQK